MTTFHRIAIADRSVLAHNVYKTVLTPSGYTLFPFKTLKDLRERFHSKWPWSLFLINSNVFGPYFEKHLDWLQNESPIQRIPKIFLLEPVEKKFLPELKKLNQSRLLLKPFYPPLLEKAVKELLEKSHEDPLEQ